MPGTPRRSASPSSPCAEPQRYGVVALRDGVHGRVAAITSIRAVLSCQLCSITMNSPKTESAVGPQSPPRKLERVSARPESAMDLTVGSTTDEGRSVIFTIRAKPGQEEALADWTHRIVSAARAHPGNVAATVIDTQYAGEYQVFHHFDSAQTLQSWLDSDERKQLLADAEPILESAPTRQLETGLETWFQLPSQQRAMVPPPRWKMWLTSVVAIYPLVLAFQAWLAPKMLRWPLELRAAVLPLVILTLMTFVVMPVVTRVLTPWLAVRR